MPGLRAPGGLLIAMSFVGKPSSSPLGERGRTRGFVGLFMLSFFDAMAKAASKEIPTL